MELVFLGPPGAGKGTQAARIAHELGLKHASTGEIFREAAASGSELGRTVRSYLNQGKLVPDELTSRVVKEMVLEKFEEFILDGFPRTVPQAQKLDEMLAEQHEELDAALYFEVDQATARERLTGRLVCRECGANYHRTFMPPRKPGACDQCGGKLLVRSDSSPQVVRQRMKEFNRKTRPLVPYYEQRGLLRRIDARQEPDEVTRDTLELIDRLGPSQPRPQEG